MKKYLNARNSSKDRYLEKGNDMKKNQVAFSTPSIDKKEQDAVLKVIKSGWLTTGKVTNEFEQLFSDFMNKPFDKKNILSLAVNSNTSGMTLAMQVCGVTKNTAIITTPYTFVSTAACAKHLGADVVFCDIEKNSYNIDADKIEKILLENEKTKKYNFKAIVPVHIAGNVCNMKKINSLAKKYKLYVIEDAAHAFPSLTSNGYAGSLSDIGVFSFYATKPLTTAEGGMVCTRNKELYKKMQILRLHGMDRTTWDRYTSVKANYLYDIVELGYKCNLPDILSAIGIIQLKKSNQFLKKRTKICQIYNKEFSKCNYLEIPPNDEGNAWHLYLLRLNLDKLSIDRDEFAKKLQDKGIGISVHFIPLFYFTYWKNLYKNFTKENFPNANNQFIRTISIPLWPDMTEQNIYDTINTIKEIGEKYYITSK